MTTLVFGKTGQVATELSRHIGMMCVGRDAADLTNPATCADLIRRVSPRVVINAAAYTAVDQAEREEDIATVVNGVTPGAMAEACAAMGIPLVHISTDYVFDGTGTAPWRPEDPTGPIGAYGRSKRAGEVAIVSSGAVHAILRASWVVSAHGNNFVKTMLRLGAERDGLNIVADQIGGPTPARDIAAACVTIATHLTHEPEAQGIYHFSGAPDVSWADFAREIFSRAGVSCSVTDIPTSAYPTPAARPLNSRLDCQSTEDVFGIARPDWRTGLTHILGALRPGHI